MARKDLIELRSYVATEPYQILKTYLLTRLEELRSANDAAPLSEVRLNQGAIREIRRMITLINT